MRTHPLQEHLDEVGRLAAQFSSAFTDPAWGLVAGRLHDLGKFAAGFQKMLAEANAYEAFIEGDASGPRDHSSAGAIHAFGLMPDERGLAIALVVAGHHGGLPAAADLLKRRLPEKRRDRCLERAIEGGAATADVDAVVRALRRQSGNDSESRRRLEMRVRMLFSALCDADFLDTERFFDPEVAEARGRHPPFASLSARLDDYLEALSRAAPATPVNEVRREVLAACREAALRGPGIFSLTVPTGGGKTLASMAFALNHAREYALRRVVVAIPFTSIIEQSAGVYRDALGEDAILEHHSALTPERDGLPQRLAAENWDAPVVVTTTVQLFESLFASRPAACRKLHNLAKSVIVLDEAQTLPPGLLAATLDGLSTLVRDYGTSVVVCTATQPALGADRVPGGFRDVWEIIPDPARAFRRLRRVRTRWPSAEPTSWDTLADEVAAQTDVLAIVHRRADARQLCQLVDTRLGDASTIHLSALMCAEHRSRILARIKEAKRRGEPVRLVSTQLVEAGVDLDFAVVYRALGGLDAMAQAAGRCNREGRLTDLGELRVYRAPSQPPPGVPATGLAIASGMLGTDADLDLFSPQTFEEYFSRLYEAQNLDTKEIQDARAALDFPEVAARYRLIEDGWSAPVVVPFGDARSRVAAFEIRPGRETLRALQRFIVNVPSKVRDRWAEEGGAVLIGESVTFVPGQSSYDERFGLVLDKVGGAEPESLVA